MTVIYHSKQSRFSYLVQILFIKIAWGVNLYSGIERCVYQTFIAMQNNCKFCLNKNLKRANFLKCEQQACKP